MVREELAKTKNKRRMYIMYEVGTMFEDGEWNETVFESEVYNEAVDYCLNDRSGDKLWLYDTNSDTANEFYFNGEQVG